MVIRCLLITIHPPPFPNPLVIIKQQKLKLHVIPFYFCVKYFANHGGNSKRKREREREREKEEGRNRHVCIYMERVTFVLS